MEASNEALDDIVGLLKEYPSLSLNIEGHTDNTGTPSANLILSRQRAETVMNSLVSKGIPVSRLQAHGYGQEKPLASNNTPQGRATNRRVVFSVNEK